MVKRTKEFAVSMLMVILFSAPVFAGKLVHPFFYPVDNTGAVILVLEDDAVADGQGAAVPFGNGPQPQPAPENAVYPAVAEAYRRIEAEHLHHDSPLLLHSSSRATVLFPATVYVHSRIGMAPAAPEALSPSRRP